MASIASENRETKVMKIKNTRYDFTLVIYTLILVLFGLIMVCSASSYTAVKYEYSAAYFLLRQGVFALIGFGVMLVFGKLNYNWFTAGVKIKGFKINLVFILYVICIGLQLAIYAVGESTNGSQRWLTLPVIGRFQPSEFSKICLILMVAYFISIAPKRLESIWGFIGILIWIGPLAFLVMKENLSTGLIICGITFIMVWIASSKIWYFILGVFGLGGIGYLYITTVGYRADRIEQWLDVEHKGYQILQGLYAICSGGIFGKGLGNSVQKLGYIPEVHTDMIFSVICEELGILGVVVLLTVYILFLSRVFKIMVNAPDLYGSMIVAGVFAHISLQIIMNIAVVTNTMPSTGVTLPFISYGGTSLMCMLAEVGLVLSVSSRIEHEY